MPKSSKKKKEKVADFTKAKLKLGKGKAQPSNAVDTSFKARSIALPSQSILAEKDDSEPVTKRQLAFGDLISHLKHYNAGTRRDAILGLKELLESNWELMDPCMAPLFTALVRLIGDEDAGVRKQLISFLAWLLPKIPTNSFVPHSPLFLLFVTSAQTHIFPEIRIDAVRVLDILLEFIPEVVTAGWGEDNEGHGNRVLGGYLGILNVGTRYGEADGPIAATSTASVVLTPPSKLAVLRSLSSFFCACLSSVGSTPSSNDHFKSLDKPLDTWFMRYAFPSKEDYLSFDELLRPKIQSRSMKCTRRIWKEKVQLADDAEEDFTQCLPLCESIGGQPWTWNELSNLKNTFEQESSQSTRIGYFSNLAKTLHSTFIETFLDCAPSVFLSSSNPSEVEVQLVISVVRIARCMYQYIVQSSQNVDVTLIECLDNVVGYMATYFPASSSKNIKIDQVFEEYNLSFCTLVSLLVKTSAAVNNPSDKKSRKDHPSRKSKAVTSLQTDRVHEYIINRLGGTVSAASIAIPIAPTTYTALLPSIWAMISDPTNSGMMNAINSAKQRKSNEMFRAVLDHALRLSSKSPCKRLTVEFIGRIILLDTSPYHPFNFSELVGPPLKPKLEAWLLHLVQVLWELGTNNVLFSEVILRMLLRILQRRCNIIRPSANGRNNRNSLTAAHSNIAPVTAQIGACISPQVIASLEARLVPYFYINHPTRGPLMGPFRKLLGYSPPTVSGVSSTYNTRPVYFLALDVAATLLRWDGTLGGTLGGTSNEAEGLKKAVGLALAGEGDEVVVTELKSYWDHVRM